MANGHWHKVSPVTKLKGPNQNKNVGIILSIETVAATAPPSPLLFN